MREPSAKGRRKANNNNGAEQEDEEEKSNSSSVGSGVPGPAEKVHFKLTRSSLSFFFVFSTCLILRKTFPRAGCPLVADNQQPGAVNGQVENFIIVLYTFHVFYLFLSSFFTTDSGQKAKLLAQLKAIDGDSPYRSISYDVQIIILIYIHIFNKDTVHLKWDFCSKESIKRAWSRLSLVMTFNLPIH